MNTPKISIIIPVYNEAQNIEKLHPALKNLDFSGDYEIIYVDDGSTDKSWEILQTFSKEQNVRCYKFDKNCPVGYARAFGVEKAKGEFIASIDADCIPTHNWLNMVKYLDNKTAVVGFPVIPPAELDYLAQRLNYIGDGKPDPNVYLHGSGAIMRRNIILEKGNYPPKQVGEDTELFRKISEGGYKFKYTDEAKIFHTCRQVKFGLFLKRFYKTGENNVSMKTFLLFDFVFPFLIFLSIYSAYLLGKTGLLSIIFPLAFLMNPKTVLYYTRNFEKPKNMVAKVILFGGIKTLVSIAFILGVWKATLKKIFYLREIF